MKIININEALNNINQDEKVGIKLAHLAGNEETSLFALELEIGQSIPAHYHKNGIENYFILSGEGVISIGKVQSDGVLWDSEIRVLSGDCFTIYPNEVHRFKNISEKKLRIIATAPLSHSNNDRYFVKDY